MKFRKRRRYFSLIFVPDQEQDPKSVSLTYFKGRVIIFLLALLVAHVFVGGYAYFRVFRLEKKVSKLKSENSDLVLQNKKIEQIAHDFEDIRRTDQKIRKAFGTTLNLASNEPIDVNQIKKNINPKTAKSDINKYQNIMADENPGTRQNNLYFLTHRQGGYYNPDYLPTLLPVEGFLTTHFQKGTWYSNRVHLGIDIAAKKGTVIRAAGAGIVLIADWTPDFGNVVIISHGNGLFTYYAHAMRLMVSQGTHVKKGDIIALLGSSGISSAPHLHFEMWKDGKPLDPEKYVYALQRRNTGIN